MHAQIKAMIQALRFLPGSEVRVDLTAGEQTPMGNILHKMFYRTDICDVIDSERRSGYPHNGGVHSFAYKGPRSEAVAVIELIKETIMENFTLTDEVRQVASEMSFISQEILSARKM